MPKKTSKNRSSRQTKQARQTRARAARQQDHVATTWQATFEAFRQAIAVGYFTIVGDHGQPARVPLASIRQHIEAGLANDPGEPPLDGLRELVGILRIDLETGGFRLRPDGLWDIPEEYRQGQEGGAEVAPPVDAEVQEVFHPGWRDDWMPLSVEALRAQTEAARAALADET